VGVEEQILLSVALIYPRRIVIVPGYRCYDPTQRDSSHMYYYFLYLAGRETGLINGRISPPLFDDVPKADMFSYKHWAMCSSVWCGER
jgi:hypothetical protein